MNKLVWVMQILLTLAFLAAGLGKVVSPLPDLIAQGMWWIEDFTEWQVRLIGVLEVLGAVGMNAPFVLKALPKRLSAAAAAGLALTMIGAFITHATRGDPVPSMVVTAVLFGLCTFVAVKRFGGAIAAG